MIYRDLISSNTKPTTSSKGIAADSQSPFLAFGPFCNQCLAAEEIDKEREEVRNNRVSTLRGLLTQKVMNGQLLEQKNDELTGQYQFKLCNLYDELDKGK